MDYAGSLRAEVTYDAQGNLARVSSPDLEERYTYDTDGRLLNLVNGTGQTVLRNTYLGGRIVLQVDADGNERRFEFGGGAAQVTGDQEGLILAQLDPFGQRLLWTDPLGEEWTTNRDDDHEVEERVDALGNTTRIEWDGRGNPTRMEDPLGYVVELAYDPEGNLVSVRDQESKETTFAWDERGNLTARTDPLGHSVIYENGAEGLIESVTDRRGFETAFTYTAEGDLLAITDAPGGVTTFTHDELGRVTVSVDPACNVTVFDYDGDSDRLRTITDALGNLTRFTFDAEGRTTAEIDALQNATTYTYDDRGLLAQIRDRNGQDVLFDYDQRGDLLLRTEPLRRETSFDYDDKGQLVEVRDAEGGIARASYDGNGNRIQQSGPEGNSYAFAYDARGDLVGILDPLGIESTRTYDGRGLVASLVNGRGQAIEFAYDAAGQTVAFALPGDLVESVLDRNGNATRTAWGGGARSITRSFDALDRLERRTDEFGNELQYGYDATGNLLRLVYPDGLAVSYAYDALGRMVQVEDWAGRTVDYTYDAVGNLVREERFDGSVVEYEYDAGQRLTAQRDLDPNGIPLYEEAYELDAAGRRVSAHQVLPLAPALGPEDTELEYGPDNRLQRYGAFASFAYDDDGNMTAGTLDGESPVDFEYDALNRLTAAGDARFRYDGEGLRVETTRGGTTRRFVHAPGSPLSRLLEEQDARGATLVRHVYGQGLLWSEDAKSGQLSVHHFDVRGSTVAVTDDEGAVTDRLAYDPWGRVVARQGSAPLRFTYVGRDGVEDDGDGLYFMRARTYAAPLMRFLQRDGLHATRLDDTRTFNRYGYVGGNPIHRTDPEGEFWNFVVQLATGAALGAAVNVAIEFVDDVKDGSIDKSAEDYLIAAAEGAVAGAILALNPAAGLWGTAGLGALAGGVSTATRNLLEGGDVLDGVGGAALVGAVGGPVGKLGVRFKPVSKVLDKLRLKSLHSKVSKLGGAPNVQWTRVHFAVKKKIGAETFVERSLQWLAKKGDEKLPENTANGLVKDMLNAIPHGSEVIGEDL